MSAGSANDVWAVGLYQNTGGVVHTLVEHWDGTAWSVIPSPNTGTYDNSLVGVASISVDDVWAVGYYQNEFGVLQTLVEHWDGSNWSTWSSPSPGTNLADLRGVAAVSEDYVWAVGDYAGDFGQQTLVERYNPCVSSPTPQLTQTPGGPSTTPVPPSNTPSNTPSAPNTSTPGMPTSTLTYTHTVTATATSCSVQFEYVASPNSGIQSNRLNGVAAVSTNDVWAVGGVRLRP